jgi:hypothetical protein
VFYDTCRGAGGIGKHQEDMLVMVAIKRQGIETAKIIALCKASICSAELSEAGITLIEDAGKAIRMYQRLAENITILEEKSDEEMRKILEDESKKVLHVRPA